jgi:hypothetical protein
MFGLLGLYVSPYVLLRPRSLLMLYVCLEKGKERGRIYQGKGKELPYQKGRSLLENEASS